MHVEPNWIDKLVSFWSPRSGARRAHARMVEQYYRKLGRRGFDGASSGRRVDSWKTSGSSANAENRRALPSLRNRARDLCRNEPHAVSAVRNLTNGIVGAGIVPHFSSTAGKQNSEAGAIWKEWAESTKVSSDERSTFYALQWLATRTVIESGEVLVLRQRRPSSFGLTVPLQLTLLEPDYLDTSREEVLSNGNFIVQGVEFDRYGRRAAYYLFDRHPGDAWLGLGIQPEAKRVPADQVLHIFEALRPGQVRGIPWFAPAILTFRDLSDFEDAVLLRAKIAAMFTAFVKNVNGVADLPGADVKSDLPEQLEAGALERLGPGEDIVFPDLPTPAGYGEVTTGSLRKVAAGLGLSYEELTGDYSQVNYSSARMGDLKFQRSIEPWRWHMLVPHLCQPAFDWWAEAAELAGALRARPVNTWTAPRRAMIDPQKEVSARIDEIRSGLQSLPGAIRENGDDPDQLLREISESNKLVDELKLILDSDARKVMKAGILQQNVSAAAGGNE